MARSAPTIRLLLWSLIALALTIGLARLSTYVQRSFAPVVLYPILAGVALGLVLVGLERLLEGVPRAGLLAGACILSLAFLAAEHYFFYADYRAAQAAALQKQPWGALFNEGRAGLAPSFADFLRSQATARQVGIWSLHAGLVIVSCVAATAWFSRASQTRQASPSASAESPPPAGPDDREPSKRR